MAVPPAARCACEVILRVPRYAILRMALGMLGTSGEIPQDERLGGERTDSS